ncbi:uncharacterized protein LOC100565545 isoform X2 [Anolis carolinensis]|uniref:uncharacterized protein LOC100565545 isoform X2 n=1 Tax=Anolis carolinensis TaxID=28377 RepID=UPI002F2B4688
MVRPGMEPSAPGGDPGLRDRYGESRSRPPDESVDPSSPFALLEDLDLWLDGWQGAKGAKGTTVNEGPPSTQEASPPKIDKDPTLDLFQASIRQAQLCVLELQGEIDRQAVSPTRPSQEPLRLTTDSEEEEDEEEEGMPEEEEEEEMECLFYDNPLFQESPVPTKVPVGFEDPASESQEVTSPPGRKEILLGWTRQTPDTKTSDQVGFEDTAAESREVASPRGLRENLLGWTRQTLDTNTNDEVGFEDTAPEFWEVDSSPPGHKETLLRWTRQTPDTNTSDPIGFEDPASESREVASPPGCKEMLLRWTRHSPDTNTCDPVSFEDTAPESWEVDSSPSRKEILLGWTRQTLDTKTSDQVGFKDTAPESREVASPRGRRENLLGWTRQTLDTNMSDPVGFEDPAPEFREVASPRGRKEILLHWTRHLLDTNTSDQVGFEDSALESQEVDSSPPGRKENLSGWTRQTPESQEVDSSPGRKEILLGWTRHSPDTNTSDQVGFEDPASRSREVASSPPGRREILLGWTRQTPDTNASDPVGFEDSAPESQEVDSSPGRKEILLGWTRHSPDTNTSDQVGFEDPASRSREVASSPPGRREILLGWTRQTPDTNASDPVGFEDSAPESQEVDSSPGRKEILLGWTRHSPDTNTSDQVGFEDPAPESQKVASPPLDPKEILLRWTKHPPDTATSDPSPILTSLPQCHPLPPLVITEEGEEEEELDLARKEEKEEEGNKTQAPQGLPPQPDGGLSGGVSEGPATDAHPAGQGLLFSACSSSLVSSLLMLEETPECRPLGERPRPTFPSPKETPPRPPPLPLAPRLQEPQRLKEPPPRASFRSHPPASCAWAEGPRGASCLREEGSAQDPHPVPLRSPLRKLPGPLDKLPTEGPAEEEEEEEDVGETAAPQNCLQVPLADPTPMDPDPKEPPQNEMPLLANGASGDRSAALRLATRLYRLDGLKKSQVASFLRKNNEFSRTVAEAYLSFFDFQGKTLDQALRSFLKAFVLTGETQERERILHHFAQRFHRCNPEAFLSPDAVHTLTCAIMLLNTDLHGQKVGKSMSCQAFVANLDGLNDGQNFPKELLKGLYHSIRQEKLEWAADEEEEKGPPNGPPPPSLSSQKKSNPFLTLMHDPEARTYRQGPLFRKMHAEADGKKTPWGKRGWKSFHTVLKGTVLYFFKDESCAEASEEPIGVHHALAERASRYTKRPHVFRLQTADWRIFLFQAQTAEEMGSWVSRLNLVSAAFSSPPFPEAVGSQRRFIRPVLPTAPCKSPLEEQYQAHGGCAERAGLLLQELQRNLPAEKRSRGRHLEEYLLRKEYLLYEKRRYETYMRLLGARLSRPPPSGDPQDLEAGLEGGPEGEEEEEEEGGVPRLQKSHSSPSLNVEGPPAATGGRTGTTAVKVKRNISERRTVRKILIPRRNKLFL